MFGRRKCYCINNNYQNNSCEEQSDIMEDKCSNVANANFSCNQNEYMDCCECGFEEEDNVFPENPMLGQSYVPIQYMDKTFKPNDVRKNYLKFENIMKEYDKI